MTQETRAPRNQTITLTDKEVEHFRSRLVRLTSPASAKEVINKTIHQSLSDVLGFLPRCFVDLLFIDPPYNLNKSFNSRNFSQRSLSDYEAWMESWLEPLTETLKPTASIYICGDWQSSRDSLSFEIALPGSERRGVGLNRIGKMHPRIFGFVRRRTTMYLMLTRSSSSAG
jgi:DNA modification methylase